mmetsp:Transcript_2799/g.6248  ORF Transcript_2799/g.6248 Transcript_2799/m.6248 type:complete len:96 (-) Transcript_2799:910-1197(-)
MMRAVLCSFRDSQHLERTQKPFFRIPQVALLKVRASFLREPPCFLKLLRLLRDGGLLGRGLDQNPASTSFRLRQTPEPNSFRNLLIALGSLSLAT